MCVFVQAHSEQVATQHRHANEQNGEAENEGYSELAASQNALKHRPPPPGKTIQG
jgi:hypothetical protein